MNKNNYAIKIVGFSQFLNLSIYKVFKEIEHNLTNFLQNKRDWMSSVRVKENEPFDVALRRFKRLIEKTGLLNDLRAREFYEKPTWERKRKAAAAVKRQYRRLMKQTLPAKLY